MGEREPSLVWRGHGFEVDRSRSPVVLVTYPADPTIVGYRAMFEHFVALAETGRRIAWLVDMRLADPLSAPASIRKEAANCFALARPKLVPVSICEARIIDRTLTRGVVTAFDWLTGHKWPCANFPTPEAAEAWIAEHLSA